MSAPRSLLEEVLPRFDVSEVQDVWGPARPSLVFAAVKQVTVRDVRLLMPLETLREDFLSFAEPGYAKAAVAFLVHPERGGSRLITETRVAGTSPQATRALLRYWRAIRLGSGAIRRSWLAAIRRRAIRAG